MWKKAIDWSNLTLRNWVFSTLECLYFPCFLQSYYVTVGKIKLQVESNLLFLVTGSCKDMKYTNVLKCKFLAKKLTFLAQKCQNKYIYILAPPLM